MRIVAYALPLALAALAGCMRASANAEGEPLSGIPMQAPKLGLAADRRNDEVERRKRARHAP